MTAPFARPENITNIVDIMTYSNTATGGGLGYVILFIITAVTYLAMLDHPPKEVFPAVMFVGFVTSIFLSVLTLVDPAVATLFLFGLAASIAWIFVG